MYDTLYYMTKLSPLAFRKLTKKESIEYILSYIEEQKQLVIRDMSNQDAFELPSWPEYQAYKLGMIKAFTKVVEIIPDQGME